MNPISVIVAEDEPLLLKTLVRQIEQSDSAFHVVFSAGDGERVLEYMETELVPEVVITDIHMPVMNGIGLIRAIERDFPSVKKVIISGYSEFEYAQQALQLNVLDYLLKPVKKHALDNLLSSLKTKITGEREAIKSPAMLSNRQYTAEDIVRSVAEFIKTNYSQELSLEEISRRFNINAPHLSKIFLKYAGESPSRYIMSLRINEAKRLLSLKKDLSVRDIGGIVGYPDPYYFSRVFKQITGMTPSDYKARFKHI